MLGAGQMKVLIISLDISIATGIFIASALLLVLRMILIGNSAHLPIKL